MTQKIVTILSGTGKQPRLLELAGLVEDIRMGNDPVIRRLLDNFKALSYSQKEKLVEKLPRLLFSSRYKKQGNKMKWDGYTGLVVVELDKLSGYVEAVDLKNKVSQSLQTVMAFISLSGRSIYVVFAFRLPDGSLPADRNMAEIFHAHAFQRTVRYLSSQLNRYIEERKPDLDFFCRMTYDRGVYFNPDAIAICMEQPLQLPGEVTYKEQLENEKESFHRLLPGVERSRAVWLLYELCYSKVSERINPYREADYYAFLVGLAEECSRAGVPEEDMVKYTLVRSTFYKQEIEIRKTIRNVYQETSDREYVLSGLNPKALQHYLFQDFMKRRYRFRYNVLKECVEYHKYRSPYFDFIPLTRREMNGICVDAHDEGIFVWDRDVKRYLESDRIPVYHPLQDFLQELPVWDGKDHIRTLAGKIHTNRQDWTEQFYKWFLYMVAQWMMPDELHANSTIPVLIGKQGYHKSTFCKMLLPPSLRNYYKEQLDLRKKKEAEWCLSRFALINLDEFDTLSPADHTYLKHLSQKTEIFEKKAQVAKKRIASLIATCNNYDILSDPTGSRRYICLELTADFDFACFPDYGQLYAQAKDAIRNKEQHWFTREEEARIMEENDAFQQIPLTEELFCIYFEKAVEEEEHEVLTCTEILIRLKRLTKAGFEVNQSTRNKFARSLKKLNIQPHRLKRGSGYRVKQIKFD